MAGSEAAASPEGAGAGTRFRGLLNALPDAVLVIDVGGRIALANTFAEELFAFDGTAMVGMPINELLGTAAQPGISTRTRDELSVGRRSDGSTFPAEVSMAAFATDGEHLTAATVRDVSKARASQVALAESEQRLLEAQSIAHVGSWHWDISTDEVTWSDELFRIYGLDPETFEPSFEEYLAHVHEDDRERNVAHVQATLERGEPYDHEYRIVRPTGEIRWLFTQGRVVRDDHGAPLAMHGTCSDVTARHEAETALAESESMLREAHAVARLGSWTLTSAGGLNWSDAMLDVHGLPREWRPTSAADYFELVHPDDRADVGEAADRVMTGLVPYDLEYRIVRPDGVVRWLHARGLPLIADGAVTGIRGTVLDITERKEAELALSESEYRLREAQAVARMGHFRHDLSSNTVAWSDEIYRIFGVAPGSIRALADVIELVHPDDRIGFQRAVLRASSADEPVDSEFRIVRPDGDVRWINTRSHTERDREGCTVALVGVAQDVTSRRQGEDLHRVVSEMVSDILYSYGVTNGRMTLEWVNPAYERITGHTLPEPLPDELFRPIIHPDDVRLMERAEATVLQGEFHVAEIRVIAKDGRLRWLRLYAQPVLDDITGEVIRIYGAAQDVTPHREAEEAFRRAYERERLATARLRDADKMKDEFLTTASHELRTPLTAIVGFASALARGHCGDEVMRTEITRKLERNALTLGTMVERLLDFSRLEAGGVVIELRPVEIAEVASRAIDILSMDLEPGRVSVDLPPGLAALADPGALVHIFSNLLSNAAKYTAGAPIQVTAQRAGATVLVSVADEGPGMPPEVVDRVFERFFRGPDQPTGLRGTGIGLAIAKSYAELMGGRLWVESELGHGTRFLFTLPLFEKAPVSTR